MQVCKQDMSETQICRECGEELPPEAFIRTRTGTRMKICRRCVNLKKSRLMTERYDC